MRSAVMGKPDGTVKITASDTAQTLTDAGVTYRSDDDPSRSAVGMLITVDKPGGSGYDLRVAWGGTVPTTTTGHIIEAGDSIYLAGSAYVNTFRFINRSSGNNAVFHITMDFEPGASIT